MAPETGGGSSYKEETSMRAGLRGVLIAVAAVLALSVGVTATASAASTLRTSKPAWFTTKFKKQVNKSGSKGKAKPRAAGPGATDVCPGIDPNSPTPATSVVSAGTCEVFPYGCTANFVYTNGSQYFIGTAGALVDKDGHERFTAADNT